MNNDTYFNTIQTRRRLVSSLAQIRIDLEREKQGTADLRREIQSYVSHVKQVETVLARKVSINLVTQ